MIFDRHKTRDSQLINGEFTAAVGNDPLALNVLPYAGGEFCFVLHHAKDQREQIQVLVVRGCLQSAVIYATGVCFSYFLGHSTRSGIILNLNIRLGR